MSSSIISNISRFTHYVFIFLFCFTLSLNGQEQETNSNKSKIQYNKYKSEISLDFKFLDRNINLNAIGTSLILRKHIGEKKFISRNEKKALRIQFGGYADYPVGKQDSLENGSNSINVSYNQEKFLTASALVGIEFQKQMNRLQVYYGFDTGISIREIVDPFTIVSSQIQNENQILGYITVERTDFSVPVYSFIGLKFFIHPRFSLSIEGAMSIGMAWRNYKRVNYDAQYNFVDEVPVAKRRALFFNTDYVRFINMSFHL